MAHSQPEQTPAVQAWPDGHAAQATPALPQAVAVSPGWHAPSAAQQPLGHEVGSHTHFPEEHRWPFAHAGAPPHSHAPDASHPSLLVASHPAQTHAPPEHVRPGGQGAPVPQPEPSPV